MLDKMKGCKNFILAPGCDMPYDVPVENAIGVAQAVYETDSVREMLKNYVAEDEDIEVELPDYEHLENHW
ncbi:hypothetical protein [Mediterraneibacter gnavus]|uniref:hypothetical protein n=2 Tax=Mediterraneibacter gnavus TaxID=33038 RepID=UPI002AC35975|nr:hypothetical protein [Mediterraneibacter gnavus]